LKHWPEHTKKDLNPVEKDVNSISDRLFFYSCFIHAPNLQNYNKKDSGESRCGVGKLSKRAIRRKSGLAMFKRKKKKSV
jgi:hypothetical protein